MSTAHPLSEGVVALLLALSFLGRFARSGVAECRRQVAADNTHGSKHLRALWGALSTKSSSYGGIRRVTTLTTETTLFSRDQQRSFSRACGVWCVHCPRPMRSKPNGVQP
jgi:hypothetical protein